MPVSDARERIALKPCYISFHIAFMFDSLRKNLLHFRWISICFMIAKNACYICILYHAYSLRIFWALSHSLHSAVPFYCIHDSILFHLKMHFNGSSQSASLSLALFHSPKKLNFFILFIKINILIEIKEHAKAGDCSMRFVLAI